MHIATKWLKSDHCIFTKPVNDILYELPKLTETTWRIKQL